MTRIKIDADVLQAVERLSDDEEPTWDPDRLIKRGVAKIVEGRFLSMLADGMNGAQTVEEVYSSTDLLRVFERAAVATPAGRNLVKQTRKDLAG